MPEKMAWRPMAGVPVRAIAAYAILSGLFAASTATAVAVVLVLGTTFTLPSTALPVGIASDFGPSVCSGMYYQIGDPSGRVTLPNSAASRIRVTDRAGGANTLALRGASVAVDLDPAVSCHRGLRPARMRADVQIVAVDFV